MDTKSLNAQAVLKKMKAFKEVMAKEISARDLDGTVQRMTVLDAFREEYPEGQAEVLKVIEDMCGKEGKYLFWLMFEDLNCPTGCDTAWEITKAIRELGVLDHD